MKKIDEEIIVKISHQGNAYGVMINNTPEYKITWDTDPYEEVLTALKLGDQIQLYDEALRHLGKHLYELLFMPHGEDLLTPYYKTDKSYRLRLVMPHELLHLPWEAMYRDNQLLSASDKMVIVRTSDYDKSIKQSGVSGALRVLFIGAQTSGQYALDVEEIAKTLIERLGDEVNRRRIEISYFISTPNTPFSRDILAQEIQKGYHVVCFAGHGDIRNGRPAILMWYEDDEGYTDVLSPQEFAALLQQRSSVRLVFLLACRTSAGSDESSGFAYDMATGSDLPAVIAMQTNIDVETGKELLVQFLDNIANYTPIDIALADARTIINKGGRRISSVIAPTLYLQAKDGALFKRVRNWWRWGSMALAVLLLIFFIFANISLADVQRSAQIAIGNEQQLRLQTYGQLTRLEEIPLDAQPRYPFLLDDAIWVTSSETGDLQKIPLVSKELEHRIHIGTNPLPPIADEDYIWVASTTVGTLTRIERDTPHQATTTNVVRRPNSMAFTASNIWLTSENDRRVARVQRDDLSVSFIEADYNLLPLMVVDNDVWIVRRNSRQATRVSDDGIITLLELPSAPSGMVAHGGYVWLISTDTLWQISPATGIPLQQWQADTTIQSIQLLNDTIWLRTSDQALLEIDVARVTVKQRYDVQAQVVRSDIYDGKLWVATDDDLIRIFALEDASHLRDIALRGSNQVGGVAYDGEHIWYTVPGNNLLQSINTQTLTPYSRFEPCERPIHPFFDGTNIWFACYDQASIMRLPAIFYQFDVTGGRDRNASDHRPLIFEDYLWISSQDSGRIILYDDTAGEVLRLETGVPLSGLKTETTEDYVWSAIAPQGNVIRMKLERHWLTGELNVLADYLSVNGEISDFYLIGDNVWIVYNDLMQLQTSPNLVVYNRHTLELVKSHKLGIIIAGFAWFESINEIWVGISNYRDGQVCELSPVTAEILACFDFPSEGYAPWQPFLIEDDLWFTAGAPNLRQSTVLMGTELLNITAEDIAPEAEGVYRFDRANRTWAGFYPIEGVPFAPVLDDTRLWLSLIRGLTNVVNPELNQGVGITMLDTHTGETLTALTPCDWVSSKYIIGDFLWVGCLAPEQTFWILHRDHYDLVHAFELGSSPLEPLVLNGIVWIAFRDDARVVAFDLATGNFLRTYLVGRNPSPPIMYADGLWVYNTSDGSLQKIDRTSLSALASNN